MTLFQILALILVGGLLRSGPGLILKSTPPSGPKITIGPQAGEAAGEAADQAQKHAEHAATPPQVHQ